MRNTLTEGDPKKVLIRFTLPLFISVIFQQLYNVADSVIAGKFAGEKALAAIGASYPITMIFMAFAVGFQIGCSVVIGKQFGRKDYVYTKTSISTAFIVGSILSLVMTTGGVLFSDSLISLVNTPKDIFDDANAYLKVYTLGFMFVFMYNVTVGVFASLGDSKTPLFLLILSSILNVVLDCLFVIQFNWGVLGVAWATFIAQGMACVFSLLVLKKQLNKIQTKERYPRFSKQLFKEISIIAIPSILQQSFVSVGNMFIQMLINGFGSSVIAGYSAGVKLNTFALTSFSTLGNGISNFTAQNMGANKKDRVVKGFKAGYMFTLGIALCFSLLFFFFSEFFLNLFLKENSTEKALQTGITFLKILSPFYIVIATKLCCDGVLRGTESMKYFMIATFTDLVLRVILAFIMAPMFSENGIFYAWPFSWLMGTVLSYYYYKKVTKNFVKNSN